MNKSLKEGPCAIEKILAEVLPKTVTLEGENKESFEFFVEKIKEIHSRMLSQSSLKQQSENLSQNMELSEEKDEVSDYETSSDGEEFATEKKIVK